jgi:hypothetical protein
MTKFLSQAEIYNLLHREAPENVYPEGPRTVGYSNAEWDSTACVLAKLYDAASGIYKNFFPQGVLEQLTEWEIKCFGSVNSTGASLENRIGALLSHLRAQANMSKWDLITSLCSMITGVFFEIVESYELQYLATIDCRGSNADLIWGRDWTLGDPLPIDAYAAAYILASQEELMLLRQRGFSYAVYVYSETLTDIQKLSIETFLTKNEPARSTHAIYYVSGEPDTIMTTVDRFYKKYALKCLPDGSLIAASTEFFFGFEGDTKALGFGDVNDPNVGGKFYSLE